MAKVLVVDDYPPSRYALRRSLESAGHAVSEAGDGSEAITLHRRSPHQLVICDIRMPVKDGIETIFELRQADSRLPIIAYTAHHRRDVDYLAIALHVGASKVFSELPLDGKLASTVSDLLAETA